MVGSQMGWNDTRLAIEHETIVRAVAHYYASSRRGEMRRKDKPPRIGVGLKEFNPRAPRLIRMRAKSRAPCRVADLQRVVHQVGTQDGFLPSAGEPYHCEPWRVNLAPLPM
jgi:hypothetical protein